MPIIDAQLHAYERDHPGQPWHAVLAGKPGLDTVTSYKINGEELFFPPRPQATH